MRHGVVAEDCDVGEAEGWNEFAVQAMVSVTLGLGLGCGPSCIFRTPLGKGVPSDANVIEGDEETVESVLVE